MQATKLDHWLKQTFVYETHVFCLRLPDQKFSSAVKVEKLNVKKLGDFKYKLTIKNNEKAQETIDLLKVEHIMYTTRVVNGNNPLNKLIMPAGGKSFTYQLLGRIFILISICSAFFWLYGFFQNEKVRELLKSGLEDLNI